MHIGLPGILFIVFLALKLTGVIAWSWLWVTAPLWIGVSFGIGALIGTLFVAVVSAARKATK